MRILIDLQSLQNNSRDRGIGRYAGGLVGALLRQADAHEVYLLLNGLFPDTLNQVRGDFAHLIPADRFIVFEAVGPVGELEYDNGWRVRASEMLREKVIADLAPDVVLVTTLFEGGVDDTVTSVGGLVPGVVTAVIFYDLIPLLDPEKYLGWKPARQWYERKLESLRRADLMLAISDWAGREAIELLNVPDDRVTSISSAAGPQFAPDAVPVEVRRQVLQRHGIDRKFLMHSSALDERKNFEGLIKAFGALPAALRHEHQLVLVCKADAAARQRLLWLARDHGLGEHDLVLTGHVSDEELVALYIECHLFVFPSFQEGFGLPPLEAMACGTPAIGSNATSIPEVIGLEEALFDPRSTRGMAALMERALTDAAFYQRLLANAEKQALAFSWARSASRALEALERAATRAQAKGVRPAAVSHRAIISALASITAPVRPTQADLAGVAHALQINEDRVSRLTATAAWGGALRWRIEGPFDSTYSLALLNRETARAMAALGHQVVLHSTEGPGDFPANKAFLAQNPDLAAMHARVAEHPHNRVDVVSRNLYPPRVADMAAPVNLLHHYAWEESGFPQHWMADFNRHLSGMTCLSRHVHKIMIDNGLTIPAVTSGCGVDHWERIEADPDFRVSARRFRFLHVSSCFPRKGVDALLDAFGRAFTDRDEVELVIKTFPNPHNEVHAWLAARRASNPAYPQVQVIEQDLSDEQLKALYQQCHVLVSPSRAEGFGLPMAEAMLSGLPVITTAWGGQMDFCTEANAWLVDYRFARAQTHFGVFSSAWAEVDVNDLANKLRRAWRATDDERAARAAAGRALLLEEFTWRDAAARAVNAARKFAAQGPAPVPRIAWVTTWNTLCGVAAYSENLIREMEGAHVHVLAAHEKEVTGTDGANCTRCWVKRGHEPADLSGATAAIEQGDFNTVVVQFNYGFYDFDDLNRFVMHHGSAGRRIVFMMHSTTDPLHVPDLRLARLKPALTHCHRILVHSVNDLNRLKAMGFVENVALFPQGVRLPAAAAAPLAQRVVPVVAAYGFCLPHKGLAELVEAAVLLVRGGRQIQLRLLNARYPDPTSQALIDQLQARIDGLDMPGIIEMNNVFMPDDQSMEILRQADLLVFPYQATGESSSAAVRQGLAAGRPVAVTPLPIFDDVDGTVHRFSGTTPQHLAQGIAQCLDELLENGEAAQRIAKAAERWRAEHDTRKLGERLHNICVALLR